MVVTLLYELVPEREESPFDLWKIIFDHHLWIIVLIWLWVMINNRSLLTIVIIAIAIIEVGLLIFP